MNRKQLYAIQPCAEIVGALANLLDAARGTPAEPAVSQFVAWACSPQTVPAR